MEILPGRDGKLSVQDVLACAQRCRDSGGAEYLTRPALVCIFFPTESGTLCSLEELEALSAVCRRFGMMLFADGARMSYGLMADGCDVTLKDFGRLADAFYLGGTKCGAMFGEAP
ncbi:beta-eliminating lyase-related protein [Mesosutterella sp. OilRF-GAM-744-9]|uniref:Beta-eliminating lyase-related protein n=1 Tax=Mesosutterella porci TaxID=2915351 RepID=A0ABS9MN95_9BURK|nr:beta-eliminating lyase-related protein [Mesosutterella sp. oilRF-744-WT-GAM-9]